MKKKRLDDLENNIGNIAPEHVPLVDLYRQFDQALAAGDTEAATALREAAGKWMKANDRFTKLAYFPPEGTAIDLHAWQRFVKYNFGNHKSQTND